MIAGAYCPSSNRDGDGIGFKWGGTALSIGPDGKVLGATSEEEPFLSMEIDPEVAKRAKSSYPRYVKE